MDQRGRRPAKRRGAGGGQRRRDAPWRTAWSTSIRYARWARDTQRKDAEDKERRAHTKARCEKARRRRACAENVRQE
jgi:hypothetical protein